MPSYKFDDAVAAGVPINEINREAASRIGYKYDQAIAAGVPDNEILDELKKRYAASEQPSKLDYIGQSLVGGPAAALDFVAPANLAVPGLIEGARALMPEFLGGISGAQAAENMQTGSIPGTDIPYSSLQPSKILEKLTGEGTIQNKAYEQANKPLHALTELSTDIGGKVAEWTGSPLVGTVANLGSAGLVLGGLHKGATKITERFQKEPVVDPKIAKAKEESEARRSAESPLPSIEKFTRNPETGILEYGNYYVDRITNTIQDKRTPMDLPNRGDYERPVRVVDDGSLPVIPDAPPMLPVPRPMEQTGKADPLVHPDIQLPKIPRLPENTRLPELPPIDPLPILRETPEVLGKTEVPLLPIESQAGTPQVYTKLASIGKDGVPKLNHEAIKSDFESGFEYIFGKGDSPTSIQKQQVFSELGLTREQFARFIPDLGKYKTFLLEHEKAHWRNKDREGYPRKEDGSLDLMSPVAIAIEKRATVEALEKVLDIKTEPKQPSGVGAKQGGAINPDIVNLPAAAFAHLIKMITNDPKVLKQIAGTNREFTPEFKQLVIEEAIAKRRDLNKGTFKQSGGMDFGIVDFINRQIDRLKKDTTPSLKEFAKQLDRGVNDPVTKELYEKYYGKVIKELTPEQAAVSKIPGLKEVISPDMKPVEEMLSRWEVEKDVGDFNRLRENLSSGGRMTALRTGNSMIDWFVEDILQTTRQAQVQVKNITHGIKGETNALTGGILGGFKNKGAGVEAFIETMTAMLKSEGKKELPEIPAAGQRLYKKLSTALEDLGVRINEELMTQGVSGFTWRPNYLAGVFFGPFRTLVKDANGKIIGVVAGKTKAEAIKAIDHVKQQMPEVQFDMVKYDQRFDGLSGSNLSNRYAKASEVLEVLKNQDASAAKLQATLSDFYAKAQENYMGYRKHFKDKSGVFGSEGARPWENAKNNAFDLLEAQLGIIDHGYHWLAEQKLMRDMDKMSSNQTVMSNMPNSRQYVAAYLDHAFGRTKDYMAFFDEAMKASAETLGIAPSAFKEMSAIARNTALTGTLGISGGFALTQFIQVPQALSIAISKAKMEGVSGNKFGSSAIGALDIVNGLNGKFENMSKEGKYFFDYFVKNGDMDPHLVEHTVHRKIVSTTGMNPIQKAIWETVNGTFKTAELASDFIGKYSIEKPEAWTRGVFAMTMAHYYKSAGYSVKEAAIKASKDTSTIFVDYSSQERAMIFQRMGELGKFASTVSTFKLNNLNQWVTFSNPKMYGALAMLALTTWATTGFNGMPGMDELEFGAQFAKRHDLIDNTPREYMLSSVNPTVAFGPLSQAATPFGGPSMSLHRKFAQDNVIPDDALSFIYPLMSFYTNKVGKGYDWVKSGYGAKEGAVFARELAPGNLKYGVDYLGLTNENGITIDPNTIHDVQPRGYKRSKNEWKLAAILGIPSQDEWRVKQINQLDKMSEQSWKASKTNKVKSAISAFDNDDMEKFQKLVRQSTIFSPDSTQEIIKYIEGRALANNIPMEKLMEMKYAKGIKSQHGLDRFKRFKEMQENK